MGVLMSTREQQLSSGYHNASVSQAQSRPDTGHNGEEGGGGGGRGETGKEDKEELLG